jgi:hypothetical protein
MLPQIRRQGFQAHRLVTEFALEFYATGTPVVCRKDRTIEKENALGGHQVFILVMMS